MPSLGVAKLCNQFGKPGFRRSGAFTKRFKTTRPGVEFLISCISISGLDKNIKEITVLMSNSLHKSVGD